MNAVYAENDDDDVRETEHDPGAVGEGAERAVDALADADTCVRWKREFGLVASEIQGVLR